MVSLFQSERIRLAAPTQADASVVAAWFENDEFCRSFDTRAAMPCTMEQILAEFQEAQQSKNAYKFAFRLCGDDVLIGIGDIESILWTHRVGWVSLALGPVYWGQGYGTEALQLLVRYAFCELDLYRLQLAVFDDNARALALYRKAGFQDEGVFRKFLLRDGKRHSMLLMGLLADEWRA